MDGKPNGNPNLKGKLCIPGDSNDGPSPIKNRVSHKKGYANINFIFLNFNLVKENSRYFKLYHHSKLYCRENFCQAIIIQYIHNIYL